MIFIRKMHKVHKRKSIYVECYADEDFLMNLGIAKKAIRHHENKYELIKALENNKNIIALIDADPNSKSEKILDQYNLINDKEGIKYYYDKKSGNKIFLIYPQLEGWLINEAKKNNLSLTKFGLSDQYSELHKKLHKSRDKHKQIILQLIEKKSKGIDRLTTLFNLS